MQLCYATYPYPPMLGISFWEIVVFGAFFRFDMCDYMNNSAAKVCLQNEMFSKWHRVGAYERGGGLWSCLQRYYGGGLQE